MILNNNISHNKKSIFINILIFISLAGFLLAWDISRVSFILLFLYSIYSFINNDKVTSINFFEKIIFLSTVFFVLSGALSYFYNAEYLLGDRVVFENYVFLLMIIPVSILLKNITIYSKLIYYAFTLLIIIASLYIFIVVYSGLNVRGLLPWLEFNSLIFAMIFTTGLLIILHYAVKTKSVISWLVFILGLVAIYFTEARGCWLTLLTISVYIITTNTNTTKNKILILLIISIFIVGLSQAPIVKRKIIATINNVQSYFENNKSTSVGHRLELYKMAIYYYKEHPVLGIGPRRLGDADFKLQQVSLTNYQAEFFNHWHFHDQYFDTLAAKGTMGIVSLFLLITVLLIYFHKNRKVTSFALMGSIVIFSYLLFGLTEVTFEHKRLTLFFSLLMALFIALVEKEKRNE